MKLKNRLRSLGSHVVPAVCLVVTLGGAAYLHYGGEGRGHVAGFAQAAPEAVAPTELAKVVALKVEIGQEVAEGQIVATLDTSGIESELSLAEAERTRIEAEVRAEQALLEQRLDVDVESIEREIARNREEQLRVNAEEKALAGEKTRVQRLVDDRQAVLEDLTALEMRQATVSALAREKPKTLGLLGKQMKAAEDRKQKAKADSSAVAAKLEADLLVAQRRIEGLERRKAGFLLRATHAGKVASVDKQPGEVVQPGEAVVRLVSARDRVVACLPEKSALGVREGDPAKLWVRGQRTGALLGKTISLGPAVTELPARCWANPKLPVWGREAVIELETPMSLVPGQAFDIAFEPSNTPKAAPMPAPAVKTNEIASAPQSMTVPTSLLSKSRFEPSGVLARPNEGRYLIVSDDTGREGDEGQPWIFSMREKGVVDPEPIALSGVDEVNDIEAIAQGDAGEIYLLSSQSYSRKGKRKASRTALLRLRPDGQGFRVDGEVHLAEMLDADTERARSLGLPTGTRELDIEGMAFQKGALYLGLKAPLDAQGNAMIWRIAQPNVLFEAGAAKEGGTKLATLPSGGPLTVAGFSLWGRARVDVDLSGAKTPGGISDLLFLQDGSLAISATPSTADGAAGALYRVDRPEPGDLKPQLVEAFPGRKPEGLTPSLSAGKLMIVFDAGSATPSFEEISWTH